MGRKKRSREYRRLRNRWIVAALLTGIICGCLSPLIADWILVIFWILFSLITFYAVGPGWIIGRALTIMDLREKRRLREFNEMWERENRGFCEKLLRIQMQKVKERKPYCNDMTGSKNDTYDYIDKL